MSLIGTGVLLSILIVSSCQSIDAQTDPERIRYRDLSELGEVDSYEDLAQFRVLTPNAYNHSWGQNLILLCVKTNAVRKGDWVVAHGLLGVSMLNVNVYERIAYRSLFLGLTLGYKMYASYIANIPLGGLTSENEIESVIGRREAAIYRSSFGLNSRYIYGSDGNFDRVHHPDKNRDSNVELKRVFQYGIRVYVEIKSLGFDDRTLRDCLGMVAASLKYDSVMLDLDSIIQLGPMQVYRDALAATLKQLQGEPNHSHQFLNVLGQEMSMRGLTTDDLIFLPTLGVDYTNLVNIIEEDLKQLAPKD